MVNVLKFWTIYSILLGLKFCFSSNCFFKILHEMANSVEPDQTAPELLQDKSNLGLHYLHMPIYDKFWCKKFSDIYCTQKRPELWLISPKELNKVRIKWNNTTEKHSKENRTNKMKSNCHTNTVFTVQCTYSDRQAWAYSVDLDETLQNVAFIRVCWYTVCHSSSNF